MYGWLPGLSPRLCGWTLEVIGLPELNEEDLDEGNLRAEDPPLCIPGSFLENETVTDISILSLTGIYKGGVVNSLTDYKKER